MFEKITKKSPYPVFNCNEEDIDWGRKIGEGISSVYKVKWDNKEYAGKLYETFREEDLIYELNIAKKLENSKQSVKVYGVILYGNNVLLLMELLKSFGDLCDYIQKKQKWIACYLVNGEYIPKPKSEFIYFNKEDNSIQLEAIKALRNVGIKTEIYPDTASSNKQQKKQWKYVSARNIAFVISEIQNNTFKLKDMFNGTQVVCTLDELINKMQ